MSRQAASEGRRFTACCRQMHQALYIHGVQLVLVTLENEGVVGANEDGCLELAALRPRQRREIHQARLRGRDAFGSVATEARTTRTPSLPHSQGAQGASIK